MAKRGKPFVFSDISHGIKEQKVVVYQVINQNSGDFLQKRLPKVFDNKWEIIISLCFHCITFHPN